MSDAPHAETPAPVAPVARVAPLPARAELRPRLWSSIIALSCALGVQAVIGTVFVVVALVRKGPNARLTPEFASELTASLAGDPVALATAGSLTALSLAAIALLAARLSPVGVAVRVRLRPSAWSGWRAPVAYALGALGALAVGESLSLAIFVGTGEVPEAFTAFADAVRAARGPVFVLLALAVVALAPLGEELMFRGYLQTRFVARAGRFGGIAITAFFFGLMHGDPIHIVVAFFIGVFLGWLVETARSIRPAIVAHVFNNAVSLATARAGLADPDGAAGAVMLVISVLVVVGATLGVRRLSRAPATTPESGASTSPSSSASPTTPA